MSIKKFAFTAITATTLTGQESGQFGDEYDIYDVEYIINEKQEDGVFTLNEFSYQTAVYIMTKDIDQQQ